MRLGLVADVEAADVLQPDQRDAVVVAGARERADLRDAGAVEDAAGALARRMLGIADEALAVDHEAGVEAADAADAADHLLADLGHDLPEQRLIDEAREHLVGVVGLAVIGRQEAGELGRRRTAGRSRPRSPR